MTDEYMSPEQYENWKNKLAGIKEPPTKPQPMPPTIAQEKRKEIIENWNNKPEIKSNHIRAIDENEEKRKSRNSKVAWFIALTFLIGVLIFAYFSYYDSYKSNIACGNVTCGNTDCAPCPAYNLSCGDCSLTCPGFPNNINVVLKNQS